MLGIDDLINSQDVKQRKLVIMDCGLPLDDMTTRFLRWPNKQSIPSGGFPIARTRCTDGPLREYEKILHGSIDLTITGVSNRTS